MNATHNGHIHESDAQANLAERFAALEDTLAQLKATLESPRHPRRALTPSDLHKVHMAKAKDMLVAKGRLTVADVRDGLSVTTKTATRMLHALNRAREGTLIFEVVGHVERLVLLRPARQGTN